MDKLFYTKKYQLKIYEITINNSLLLFIYFPLLLKKVYSKQFSALCRCALMHTIEIMQNLLNEIAQMQSAQEAKLAKIEQYTLLAAKQVLTADDVVLLTGLKKSYLYKLTAMRQIPHYKPNGKCIFFDRSEIEQWQKQHRIATELECEQGAIKHALS